MLPARALRPFRPEFALVAACALFDDPALKEAASGLLGQPGFDWDHFADQAAYHGVELVVRSRLAEVAPDAIPRELEDEWQRLHLQNVALQEVQLKSATAISDVLRKAGAPALFLKGAALAHLLYSPNPEHRASNDIDVLVAPDALPIADEALRRAGFRRTWPTADPPEAARPMLLMLANVFEYRGPVYGELVELHCRPTLNPYWLRVDFAALHASSVLVETRQGPILSIDGPICLEYLCQHALFYLAGFRLKWFADIVRMLQRGGAESCVDYAGKHSGASPGDAMRLADEVLCALTSGICEATGRGSPAGPISRDAAWIVREIVEMRRISPARTFSRLPLELANMSLVLRHLPGWRARGYTLLQALSDPRDALTLKLGTRYAVLYGFAGPLLALSRFLRRKTLEPRAGS